MSGDLVISQDGEILEFDPDGFSGYVFEFRINCKEGKVFLGESEKCLSVTNQDGRHELDFTFVMFRVLRQPADGILVSKKYHKVEEWGQLIGIDANGIVFSALIKVYALSSIKQILADFMYDKGTGKETGMLAGRLVKLCFGDKIKDSNGDYYSPKFLLKEQSKFFDKAMTILEQKKNGDFHFPKVPVVKNT